MSGWQYLTHLSNSWHQEYRTSSILTCTLSAHTLQNTMWTKIPLWDVGYMWLNWLRHCSVTWQHTADNYKDLWLSEWLTARLITTCSRVFNYWRCRQGGLRGSRACDHVGSWKISIFTHSHQCFSAQNVSVNNSEHREINENIGYCGSVVWCCLKMKNNAQ